MSPHRVLVKDSKSFSRNIKRRPPGTPHDAGIADATVRKTEDLVLGPIDPRLGAIPAHQCDRHRGYPDWRISNFQGSVREHRRTKDDDGTLDDHRSPLGFGDWRVLHCSGYYWFRACC